VKLLQHLGDFRRGVCGNINPGGERASLAAQDDNRDCRKRVQLGKSGKELIHHWKVDDVEWRMLE